MGQYYYLVSSLPELSQVDSFSQHPYPLFHQLAQEELSVPDYRALRSMFLLHDVSNLAQFIVGKKQNNQIEFQTPSLYEIHDFMNGDELIPVFEDILWEYQEHPDSPSFLHPQEFILQRLMEALVQGEVKPQDDFVQQHLIWEMRERNLALALSRRQAGLPYHDDIVVFDDFSQKIATDPSSDFGLGGDLEHCSMMLDTFVQNQPFSGEKILTDLRWLRLSETLDVQPFHRNAVLSYAVKIADVERWLFLSPQEGKQRLDALLKGLHQQILDLTHQEVDA
ncbi:MAG: DUF2764 domain-containing protein [Spirochaetales bacterium]|nr:DUF2764 domain-containing protein [Spirochaetales bacterium]